MMVKESVMTGIVVQPVLWSALGYQFEAASMIAGLSACLMVRIWVSLNSRSATLWTWGVDLTVTAIAAALALTSLSGCAATGEEGFTAQHRTALDSALAN